MENEEILTPEQEETSAPQSEYKPRPLWQVIGAWVLLVVFIAIMVASYIRILGGAG